MLSPRPYLIEEYTTTVCPGCFAAGPRRSDEDVWRDGLLVSHDGQVWLRRFCAEHGETESLYEEDLEIWRARAGWGTPTLQITPDRADNFAPFPAGYRDGLPASHGQHTCILLLNVTQRCNYACPTCYASAQAPGTATAQPEWPTPEQIAATVRTMLAREGGKLGVLMLSGGEPTVRDDLPAVIEAALAENITRVLINTNGRRIARDDRFLDFLRRHKDRIEVYLQFDGLRPSSHLAHRGEDVSGEKLLALRRLQDAGVWNTMVMTLARGVNEDEAGDVLQLGLSLPRTAGLAIQPVFGSGRNAGFDPRSRSTPTGVLRRLEAQTGGLVNWRDFIPLPCSHQDCCDITYLLQDRHGKWQSLPRLLGPDELKRWIHLVSNTISFDNVSGAVGEMLKSGAIQRIFSEQQKVPARALAADIAKLCGCVQGLPDLLDALFAPGDALERAAEKTFRLTVKMFMDAHTLHAARIRQCCVHTGTYEPDPRRYSFCWRWLFADASDFPEPRPQNLIELRSG